MPNEPAWLAAEQVVLINRLEVEETGEPHALVSPALLESAVARPRNLFVYGEEDMPTLAIGLMVALARNHAFLQGNKRTAHTAAIQFTEQNGYLWCRSPDDEYSAVALEDYLTGQLSEEDLVELFRDAIEPAPVG